MSYSSNEKKEHEDGISLDNMLMYLKKLLNKWWLILLSAVVVALLGFIVAKVTYVDKYSSQIMFIASNRDSAITVAGQSASDINASVSLAESFKYVFTTTELATNVANSCGYQITAEQVKKFISVNSIEDTSIIYLTVTTTDPRVSYGIAKAYVENYPDAIEKAFPNTRLAVIDPPLLAENPNINNDTLIYTTLGFVLGALLACFFIVLSVIIKDTIKSSDEVSEKLNVALLGSINKVNSKSKNDSKQGVLVTDKKTGFSFIEAYKLVRTKIEYASAKKGYKTIVVSSTTESEGKTTTATNIALSLAQNGKSVLLIDADLRKPAVAKTLGFAATDDEGICGIISGDKTLKESIKYSEKYQLFVLVSGKAVDNSSEILSSPKMEEIIESAKKEFDFVIIDTAPCGILADAAIVAGYADTSVIVVKQDCAPARKIKRAIDNIENSGIEILGCIYNNAERSFGKPSLYGKKSGYGYGYGYGYSYGGSSANSKHNDKRSR